MVPQQKNWLINKYGLILVIGLPLTALTIACSHRSQTTQSGQSANQSVTQATYSPVMEEEVFTVCEVPPSFPGGNAELGNYLRQNLRYPEAASKAKIDGKVFVAFIVTNQGLIRDVNVLKGLGYGTNEEAVRLVQTMPAWIPGKQAGRFVNVKYNLVIPFVLASQK
ncbi:energy transducer TonB [Spirosoma aerophilum]